MKQSRKQGDGVCTRGGCFCLYAALAPLLFALCSFFFCLLPLCLAAARYEAWTHTHSLPGRWIYVVVEIALHGRAMYASSSGLPMILPPSTPSLRSLPVRVARRYARPRWDAALFVFPALLMGSAFRSGAIHGALWLS
eukprot:RCo005433